MKVSSLLVAPIAFSVYVSAGGHNCRHLVSEIHEFFHPVSWWQSLSLGLNRIIWHKVPFGPPHLKCLLESITRLSEKGGDDKHKLKHSKFDDLTRGCIDLLFKLKLEFPHVLHGLLSQMVCEEEEEKIGESYELGVLRRKDCVIPFHWRQHPELILLEAKVALISSELLLIKREEEKELAESPLIKAFIELLEFEKWFLHYPPELVWEASVNGAIRSGCQELLKWLLTSCRQPNHDNKEKVELLLLHDGFPPYHPQTRWNLALSHAVRFGRPKIFEFLTSPEIEAPLAEFITIGSRQQRIGGEDEMGGASGLREGEVLAGEPVRFDLFAGNGMILRQAFDRYQQLAVFDDDDDLDNDQRERKQASISMLDNLWQSALDQDIRNPINRRRLNNNNNNDDESDESDEDQGDERTGGPTESFFLRTIIDQVLEEASAFSRQGNQARNPASGRERFEARVRDSISRLVADHPTWNWDLARQMTENSQVPFVAGVISENVRDPVVVTPVAPDSSSNLDTARETPIKQEDKEEEEDEKTDDDKDEKEENEKEDDDEVPEEPDTTANNNAFREGALSIILAIMIVVCTLVSQL